MALTLRSANIFMRSPARSRSLPARKPQRLRTLGASLGLEAEAFEGGDRAVNVLGVRRRAGGGDDSDGVAGIQTVRYDRHGVLCWSGRNAQAKTGAESHLLANGCGSTTGRAAREAGPWSARTRFPVPGAGRGRRARSGSRPSSSSFWESSTMRLAPRLRLMLLSAWAWKASIGESLMDWLIWAMRCGRAVEEQVRPAPAACSRRRWAACARKSAMVALVEQILDRRRVWRAPGRRCRTFVAFIGAPAFERGLQLGDAHGFGDVIVHAGLQAFLAVADQGVAGHGDDARALVGGQRWQICRAASRPSISGICTSRNRMS